jgi:hypothetical protein
MTWPFPGDTKAVRDRKVALAYRQRLEECNPQACADLDEIMRRYGQQWVIPRPVTTDVDAYISAADAADLAAVSMSALRKARCRGKVGGRQDAAGRWEYRVGEILAMGARPRTRTRNGDR